MSIPFPGGKTAFRCLTLALTAPSLLAAPEPKAIPARSINHMVVRVTDLDRSLKWYQGLFGLAVIAAQKDRIALRIGNGPQHLVLLRAEDAKPGIARIAFGIKDFKPRHSVQVLDGHGISSARQTASGVEFRDPAGINVRLRNETFAGGDRLQPPASVGLLPIRGFNHFTIFVPDARRNVRFYQQLLGLRIDTYQGPMPIIRVGDGNQFLAFVGGRTNAFVHHACFVVNHFDPDRVLTLLSRFGVKPRGNKRGPAGPLQSYVVMRMPDRGGAPGGTPELYLTDPDGILLQIQDARYAGGGGYLGELRGTPEKVR